MSVVEGIPSLSAYPFFGVLSALATFDSQHRLTIHLTIVGGGGTNPYTSSLLDDCNIASKKPVYMLFRPNLQSAPKELQ